MKLKLKHILIFVLSIFIGLQIFLFIAADYNNSSILIYANSRKSDTSLFLINQVIVDTVDLNDPIVYLGLNRLKLGSNDIIIKEVDGKIKYQTKIYYFGLFGWHSIDIIEQDWIIHKKRYFYFF